MASQDKHLGVSTVGNRKYKTSDGSLEQATHRLLKHVEHHSSFFDQVEPYTLPSFEPSEIEQGEFLGCGEFGDVWEVKGIHVAFECPCVTCGEVGVPEASISASQPSNGDGNETSSSGHHHAPRRKSPVQIIVDEALEAKLQEKVGASSVSMPSAMHPHRRNISQVSFAEDLKSPEEDERHPTLTTQENIEEDNDDSTLSTEDEESVTNLVEDEENTDGEVTFLRGYMSTHLKRHGIARYAIKRPRKDLDPDTMTEAVLNLAVEAKFLATIRHPNIVKMRGTVGTPGTIDFMIVMDRLNMTLREKMTQWKDELKGKRGMLGNLLGQRNQALEREQYADKLLAVYDIARAMRYLHNHMIIFRDLKPENVAVDVRGDMRLFDFGLCKELKQKDLVEPPDDFQATGLTGSRRYMAPEVVACKNYGLKADVYSFAIVFWEVFAGQEAYTKMSFDKHFDQVVMKGKRPSTKAASANTRHLSKSLLHLMPEMWSANPKDRPAFLNICDRLAGECILSSTNPRAASGAGGTKDSDQSHQSYLTDRTRYLMNRSLRSRYASDVGDSSDSAGSRGATPQSQ